VLLVAFTLYAHTARSRRDLAVLKALGFRNRHVYAGVVLQAVVLTGVATVIALSLAMVVTLAAPYVAPALSLHMTSGIVVKVGLAGLAIAIVASLVSARQVANVDPLTAFQR